MRENPESLAAVERERERAYFLKNKKSLAGFLHQKFNMVKIAK